VVNPVLDLWKPCPRGIFRITRRGRGVRKRPTELLERDGRPLEELREMISGRRYWWNQRSTGLLSIAER